MTQTAKHQPVMLTEAIKALKISPQAWYLDATFGRGGHTREILAHGGNVIAFDVDEQAIEYGQDTFQAEIRAGRLELVRENFDRLETVINQRATVYHLQGILFDFGTSVDQLTDEQRGFSFDSDAPLDMRMDNRLGVTAADLLNILSEKQMSGLFIDFGGEHQARSLAKAIVHQRETLGPITDTSSLVSLIMRIKGPQRTRLHPATQVFQALRIAVNSEVNVIEAALPQALDIVSPGGRIVTIAFHEGEDRPVKYAFRDWEAENLGQVITKKPIIPTELELESNPRARSAKLRVFEKKQWKKI